MKKPEKITRIPLPGETEEERMRRFAPKMVDCTLNPGGITPREFYEHIDEEYQWLFSNESGYDVEHRAIILTTDREDNKLWRVMIYIPYKSLEKNDFAAEYPLLSRKVLWLERSGLVLEFILNYTN